MWKLSLFGFLLLFVYVYVCASEREIGKLNETGGEVRSNQWHLIRKVSVESDVIDQTSTGDADISVTMDTNVATVAR